jgi:hypothetical protein
MYCDDCTLGPVTIRYSCPCHMVVCSECWKTRHHMHTISQGHTLFWDRQQRLAEQYQASEASSKYEEE